jgi:hypothetical protein
MEPPAFLPIFVNVNITLITCFGFNNSECAQHSKYHKGTVQSWLLHAAGPPFQQSAWVWVHFSVSRANCYLDDMRGWSFCIIPCSLAQPLYIARNSSPRGFMTLFRRHDFGPDFRSRRHCLWATANKTNTDVTARIDLTAVLIASWNFVRRAQMCQKENINLVM